MIFFANANRIRNHGRELTRLQPAPPRAVLINLEASPEVDLTSLEMLEQLRGELQQLGTTVYFARVADRVRDLFERSGFLDRVGPDRLFPGVDLAVKAFLKDDAAQPEASAEKRDRGNA